MGKMKPVVRLADDYLRANRERLQKEFDAHARVRLIQDEITRRFDVPDNTKADTPERGAWIEHVQDDWVVFRLDYNDRQRWMKSTFEIIAGHVILGTPTEVVRNVTYRPVAPPPSELHIVNPD
jgi:hypothetical protein